MLPDPITFQFEKAHACAIFTKEKDAKNVERPKLYIQCIDAYGRQLELSIQYRHEPGEFDKMHWELHAYRHPGVREICTLPKKLAEEFISRILDLCARFPSLLFNDPGHGLDKSSPNCSGFVRLHTGLLDGYKPSLEMLP
jgi:hypothetical protein